MQSAGFAVLPADRADTGWSRSYQKTMSWKFSQFTSTLAGLFRESDAQVTAENRMEEIRDEMLQSIFSVLEEKAARPPVLAKVLYARDVESLWYQRSDLMSLLSEHQGETRARQKIDGITQRFVGLLPPAQLAQIRRKR